MDQLTNGGALASALRSKASEVREVYSESTVDNQALRDAASLLRVLANVVEGMSMPKAFGAPGDWGYETELGKAVLALHRTPAALGDPQ